MKKNPNLETVLELVMKKIRYGCSRIDKAKKLDQEADDLFRRRYSITFELRLAEEGSWERDRDKVLTAAEMHGVIAAAAAKFTPGKTIPLAIFVKAGHILELECYDYVSKGQARRRQRNEPLFGGPWCW